MGLSYLSSLLSLEFLREPVGAGEGLVPTEDLLGVAWKGTVGMTPEMGQAGQGAGAGGRTSGTSTSMRALGSQQESPRGRICSSWGMSQCPWQDQGSQPSLPTPDAGPMVRASPKGIPKASPAAQGHLLLTSPLTVSSVGRKRRRRPRWWRTLSQQSLSWQDEPHVRRQQ